jgi:peptidylamidoglycolate lyase
MVYRISTALVLFFFLAGCVLFQSSRKGKGTDDVQRYQLVDSWPASEISFGNPTGIGINSHQDVIVFHRAGRTWPLTGSMPSSFIEKDVIYHLDAQSGKLKHSWGAGLFIMPHGLTIDAEDNFWLTDVALHQVFKFDKTGRLLMKLGEAGKQGSDSIHFSLPTDVAVAADQSFYVADGYGNSRVVKFSKEGKYLFEWGKAGNGQGEFNIPHAIDIDDKGTVYVADRENRRVQAFTAEGKWIREIGGDSFAYIYSNAYDTRQRKLFAVDADRLGIKNKGSDVYKIGADGAVINRFGRSGFYDGPLSLYHDLAIDDAGNIYIGDILNNKVHKFQLKN